MFSLPFHPEKDNNEASAQSASEIVFELAFLSMLVEHIFVQL